MNKLIETYKQDPINNAIKMSLTELIKIIEYAADKYYNDISVLSDSEYDILVDVLKDRDPKNKILKMIGAKVLKNKVKLPYYMGSMDKIKPDSNNLEKWINKYDGPYILSDKLDGVSGLFVRKDGISKLYTRGDGNEGTDISNLIKYIDDLNIKLEDDIAVRGELIMSKDNFKKYSDKMANARNMVSGLVNSKTVDVDIMKDMNFVAYELIDKNMKLSNQLIKLSMYGFRTVYYDTIDKISKDILSKQLSIRRNESMYEIDGIIVSDDKIYERNTDGNPEYAFAFKETSEMKDAVVRKVEWNISKDGYLKPTIIIDPIYLSGVLVKRATAFNGKYVKDNNIGENTIVTIVRSGEVIPYINEVKKSTKADMPNVEYKWNNTGVDIYYDKKSNNKGMERDYTIKNLTYFFKQIDIKNVDEATIGKMYDIGLTTIKKILNASIDDFKKMDNFGDKSASNLYNSIQERIKEVELLNFMVASNIFGHGLGIKKLELLLENYPNILDKDVSKDEIMGIRGYSEISYNKINKGIPKLRKLVGELNEINIVNKYKKHSIPNNISNNKLNNEIIVFTGFRNSDWEEYVKNSGGKITNSISKNTTMLVAKDKNENTSKLNKAKELNIKILSMDEFKHKYNLD